jgi:hypothetical protein
MRNMTFNILCAYKVHFKIQTMSLSDDSENYGLASAPASRTDGMPLCYIPGPVYLQVWAPTDHPYNTDEALGYFRLECRHRRITAVTIHIRRRWGSEPHRYLSNLPVPDGRPIFQEYRQPQCCLISHMLSTEATKTPRVLSQLIVGWLRGPPMQPYPLSGRGDIRTWLVSMESRCHCSC